ncbi:hypothetical protein CHS0354_029766 [Potamilus streckersoni]|uniref:Uncharacterized protein n=1 Tax=Potamilus streckersoni TaxID=2493646 RepID=A0AAE0TI04_9BIVA|nr:hypothetical protein CHS0354_029766 [Potamilus streckersoni]
MSDQLKLKRNEVHWTISDVSELDHSCRKPRSIDYAYIADPDHSGSVHSDNPDPDNINIQGWSITIFQSWTKVIFSLMHKT